MYYEARKAAELEKKIDANMGNMEKAVTASIKQIMAIEKIQNSIGLDELGDDLKTLALMRLQHKTLSLQELADSLKISKSCLNHRMRRLMEIASGIEQ